ncbi:hypothetical protein BO71DRAFT_430793 [Aspergillus ellipticus CBS 707.79]|uniref:Uncharacterized protein n=1 Tax=Aspergillus ellipticus CBS 707.79 TaxID=1448320 RepID=A0A319ERQ9_9EURO|nr:hypothetical protein BO71DRAFT_430793 [Aspergillus ellipticus CBS 707.79]
MNMVLQPQTSPAFWVEWLATFVTLTVLTRPQAWRLLLKISNLDNSEFSARLSAPDTSTSTRITMNLHNNVPGLDDDDTQPRVFVSYQAPTADRSPHEQCNYQATVGYDQVGQPGGQQVPEEPSNMTDC